MKLRCNKILITGGGRGIGFEIARKLLSKGASVTITGRNMNTLEEAKSELASDNLYTMVWDVTDFTHCRENIQKAEVLMNGLDGLVNNAFISTTTLGRGYEPWDITPDEWDTLMDTNLKGWFFIMRDFIDYLIERGTKGNVLNISSNAACINIGGTYGISKLSILEMTRTFGKRFGSKGIIINGIAPGATFRHKSQQGMTLEAVQSRLAIGRYIQPEEIAELAAYLMSDFGEIICGHTVVADGGDKYAY